MKRALAGCLVALLVFLCTTAARADCPGGNCANELALIAQRQACWNTFHPAGGAAPDIVVALVACPALANLIVFVQADDSQYAFPGWDWWDRDRLQELYAAELAHIAPVHPVACPNIANQFEPNAWAMFITGAQAKDMFIAAVAHSLWVDTTQAVNWSILDFSTDSLRYLFNSEPQYTAMHNVTWPPIYPAGIFPGWDYRVPWRTRHGAYVCDPAVGYRLVTGDHTRQHQNLVGGTALATVKNLSLWFSKNVGHGGAPANIMAAKSSIDLIDRLHVRDINGNGTVASEGCHGAADLFFDIARSVNLPVVPAYAYEDELDLPVPAMHGTFGDSQAANSLGLSTGSHGGLVFAPGSPTGDERVLAHADDIYANGNRGWIAKINETGAVVTDDDMGQTFFERTWRTPTGINSAGFHYYLGASMFGVFNPWVSPGDGGYGDYTGPNNDFNQLGQYLGWWRPAGGDVLHSSYNWVDNLEQAYSLCRWTGYAERMCYHEQAHPGNADALWEGEVLQVLPPDGSAFTAGNASPQHSRAAHLARVHACLNIGGGCVYGQVKYDQIYSILNWGLDYYL